MFLIIVTQHVRQSHVTFPVTQWIATGQSAALAHWSTIIWIYSSAPASRCEVLLVSRCCGRWRAVALPARQLWPGTGPSFARSAMSLAPFTCKKFFFQPVLTSTQHGSLLTSKKKKRKIQGIHKRGSYGGPEVQNTTNKERHAKHNDTTRSQNGINYTNRQQMRKHKKTPQKSH